MSDELDAKPFWQSRTIIGAFVVIAAQILRFKGFHVDTDATTDDILTGLNLVGAALALVGRIKATRPITFMRGTAPGGAFNPEAPVKKAEPVKAGGTPTLPGNSGRADVDAVIIVGVLFLLVGVAFCGFRETAPLVQRPVPDLIGGRPVSQWMQVVPVVDSRPFIARLISSLRCTPSTALVTTEQGITSLRIVQVEITGGADF